MTNLGASYIRRGALASLQSPPSRVIARRAQARRGNLGKAVTNSPEAFLRFSCILRDCRALLRKARNDKSGNLPLPEGRRDKLACASHPCHCEEAEGRRGNLK